MQLFNAPPEPATEPAPPRTPVSLAVLLAPHRTLNLRSKAVDTSYPEAKLRNLLADMVATVLDYEALGLAAPQVGFSCRVIVVRASVTDVPRVLVNPRISRSSGSSRGVEGCLSLPTKSLVIRRSAIVQVGALEDGKAVSFSCEGMLGRVIQHEIDHLDGILMTSRRS